MENSDNIEKRKFKRSEFAYPVEIKVLTQHLDSMPFKGYIEDISPGGARIQFEDRYGRIDFAELSDSKIKVAICMPRGEKITVLSRVKRIENDSPKPFFIEVGVEFESLEDWQLEAINKLISLKNKDQNMMWRLWEQYEKQL